uniref:tetratricopeptide repeat protein n=1 Tax=Calothrix sp. CCY 0018 TaxID=3103864 RepID=UPI0039C63306
MSINKKQVSDSQGNRALQLFIDRHHLIKYFAECINNDPVEEKIQYIYGDGGNGKSLLLKYLRTKCCNRFHTEKWQEILRQKDLKLLANNIAIPNNTNDFDRVPAVLHDFGLAPIGEDKPQDVFYGLLMLRRNIGIEAKKLKYKLRFPLFDFACVWYLHQKRQLSKDRWKELFPEEEFELTMQILDTISNTSWGEMSGAVLNVILKRFGKNKYILLQQRGLKKEAIEEIRVLDIDTELIFELPRLLAQDLNSAMSQKDSPERLVLFFDTHEAFWGNQRNIADYRYFQQDRWLRYFLAELEFSHGIVVVVAGREIPRWQNADEYPISLEHLDIQLVNHLAQTDAREYLRRAGISNQDFQQSAIDYASARENQVHPFLLGLCADVILQGKQGLNQLDITADFGKKAKQLINLLLKYVDREIEYAVHTLSACRSFNYDIYELLGKELKFQASKPSFDVLTEFSFVWETQEQGEDWYRIHDLLRRLDYEGDSQTTRQAHEVLEKYYRGKGEVAEAIYHANRLDWQRGVEEWVEEFDKALKLSRYDRCRVLLEIRNELIIPSDFQLGRVSQAEGDYFKTLAQHQQAEQEYQQAIESFDEVLRIAPDDINAHVNKGIALQGLGELQADLSQHQDAQNSYTQAIVSYNQVLSRAPDDILAHGNKGLALQSLGDLQAGLSQHQDAQNSYNQAIESHNQVFRIAPDLIITHNNKGLALQRLGELQADLSQHQDAQNSYTQAIVSYNQVLSRAPDDILAHGNKGLALQSLGDLQAGLSQHQDAQNSYNQAIESHNQVFRIAPDLIITHNNKGLALQRLGDLQAGLSQHQDAQNSYTQAIVSYNQVLSRAPDDILAQNNKGFALQSLGDLQAGLSQHQDAQNS